MSGTTISDTSKPTTLLAAPVQLAEMAHEQEQAENEEFKSVWIVERDDTMVC